jgi:hypothetical protein
VIDKPSRGYAGLATRQGGEMDDMDNWVAVEGTDESIKIAWHGQFETNTVLHFGGWTVYRKDGAGALYIPAFYPVTDREGK